jgi:hypothetical protein
MCGMLLTFVRVVKGLLLCVTYLLAIPCSQFDGSILAAVRSRTEDFENGERIQ